MSIGYAELATASTRKYISELVLKGVIKFRPPDPIELPKSPREQRKDNSKVDWSKTSKQQMCMARMRAERRGEDISIFPKRERAAKRTSKRWLREHQNELRERAA